MKFDMHIYELQYSVLHFETSVHYSIITVVIRTIVMHLPYYYIEFLCNLYIHFLRPLIKS